MMRGGLMAMLGSLLGGPSMERSMAAPSIVVPGEQRRGKTRTKNPHCPTCRVTLGKDRVYRNRMCANFIVEKKGWR